MMDNRYARLRRRILSGRSDANVRFDDLRRFLLRLGFEERYGAAITYSERPAFAND